MNLPRAFRCAVLIGSAAAGMVSSAQTVPGGAPVPGGQTSPSGQITPGGQTPARQTPNQTANPLPSSPGANAAQRAGGTTASLTALTLTDAIGQSQSANTTYAQAIADNKVAQAQVGIARSALLPGVVYHNQFLYTQAQHLNGKPSNAGASTPIFIANNTVHEYISQGVATETVSASLLTDLRRTEADAAVAKARLEVARRGLVATVVITYYTALADQAKVVTAQQALDEAQHFATLSIQLELGGEVAHADVIKANLQVQQRQRDLAEAQLAAGKSRIDLAVLLYPNPLAPFTLSDDLIALPELPEREAINVAANHENPDLNAAVAAFKAAQLELTSARFDFLPSLILNYSYGIDSPQFAVTNTDRTRNLGYSASATLDLPVWDWFATRNRVRQSAARRDLARAELTSTQRRLVASIEELYREAQVARDATQSLDRSVRDATTALGLSEARYQAGEAPILEIVDAQNTLLAVQNSRTDSAARLKSALANLQTLTGNMP